MHELRSVTITGLGIDVETWRDRLLKIHKMAGRIDGPTITNNEGHILSYAEVNDFMWNVLEEIYLEDDSDFPQAITCTDDIRIKTNINRTI